MCYNDFKVGCLQSEKRLHKMYSQSKVTNYKTACYCRLSRDDEKDGMSVSIETQMKILNDYCKANDYEIIDFYCDDGYSGTNFNRPAFQRMLKDVENGKVNMIIVKDLSRFGRNHVKTSEYIGDIFPKLNVRFVAIGDNFDTDNENSIENTFSMWFKNMFNEFYPADISRKTRLAFKAKAQRGEFIGTYAPYGYKKSEKDKHILEIDDESALIVKDIFEMVAYMGYGYNKISHILAERKVLTPTAYREKQNNISCSVNPYDWNLTTIRKICENRVYLGHTVNGKKQKRSYKDKDVIIVPENEWITVENTHPAIIQPDLWELTQSKLNSRKRERKNNKQNIFAGLIKCDTCGKALTITTANNKAAFACSTYKTKGKENCTVHFIAYDDLYEIVLNDLKSKLNVISQNDDVFKKTVKQKTENNTDNTEHQKINSLEKRISELERKINCLYDDRADGIISKQRFVEMYQKCESEQNELKKQLDELNKKLTNKKSVQDNESQFIQLLKEYCTNLQELNAELLNRLIEKIVVGNKEKTENGYTQTVKIYYRFVGNV